MNIAGMMKKAQEMQKKMQEMQDKLADITEEGSAGADMVKITVNGKHDIKSINIAPDLIVPEDKEMLEDLIVAAYNDAKQKVEARNAAEMEKLTGGMGLPGGMKLPF